MPLPPPESNRELSHSRTISINGYRRGDGLWDVEGHLIDTRPYDADIHGAIRPAGQAIHEMWVRLTVDTTGLIIEACAATDAGPFPHVCGNITPQYQRLAGLRVGPGFRGQVRRLLGGVSGCTHLSELVFALGTGVIQTLAGHVAVSEEHQPFHLDGCHALDTSGPVVEKIYPQWHRPKKSSDGSD